MSYDIRRGPDGSSYVELNRELRDEFALGANTKVLDFKAEYSRNEAGKLSEKRVLLSALALVIRFQENNISKVIEEHGLSNST